MTITTHTAADPLVCTNTACLEASSHRDECECSCDGVDHGHVWKPARAEALARVQARTARDPFLGAARASGLADLADRGFGITVVRSVIPVYLDDDEMPF